MRSSSIAILSGDARRHTTTDQPRVYIVDDQRAPRVAASSTLKVAQCIVRTFESGDELLEGIEEDELPDLILADIRMPGIDGFGLCRELKNLARTAHVPIILMSGTPVPEVRVEGFEAGADDFIQKPFFPDELQARVRTLLNAKKAREQLSHRNRSLEVLVDQRTRELEIANRHLHDRFTALQQANHRLESLQEELERVNIGLVTALEKANLLNDEDTGLHILRVCLYSEQLAEGIGMDEEFCRRIRLYASLHDVGKVGIADAILKKPGKFTPEEYEEMKSHTEIGYEILRTAGLDVIAQNVARHHHERWDGAGYPMGLAADQIPIEARIVALADVWDALTQKRCYKEAFPEQKALEILREERGKHFDPMLVDCLERMLPLFRTIQEENSDPRLNRTC